MKKINIGFFGMSHLGLCYSAVASEKKFNVIGFDLNKSIIQNLNNQNFKIYEKDLPNIVKKNINKNLFYTSDIKELKKCKIIFLSQDIKTDINGNSNLKDIKKIIDYLLLNISKKTIIVILSQIPLNFIRSIKWPKSKLYYQVETLVFGNGIYRAMNPERIIIGKEKKISKINSYYSQFLKKFKSKIIEMNYESAELAKISINLFLIANVSTANSLARIAENIGADWNSIVEALKLDRRIGKYSYIYPGLGLSGGNLERDLNTISKISRKIIPKDFIFESFKNNSLESKKWIIDILKKSLKKSFIKKITILGISYKAGTNSIKNSPTIEIINSMKKYKFKVHDPIVKIDNSVNTEYCKDLKKSLKDTDVIIIMNKSNIYSKITINFLKNNFKGKIIFDPFGVLTKIKNIKSKYIYFCLGVA